MALFEAINNIWQNFLNVFPPEYRLFIASAVLIILIVSFVSLFVFNPLFFFIALIIAIPIAYPVLVSFLTEMNRLIFGKLFLSLF